LLVFGKPLLIAPVIERKFFNPYGEIRVTQNRVPHWQQDGATYFVTFRLADSLPKNQLDQWRTERDGWLKVHPKPWTAKQDAEYHRQFSARLEGWLDQGAGKCLLSKTETRMLVEAALREFDGARHAHHAWVIMPNHVHALFSLAPRRKLESILHQWKGSSARAINGQLKRAGPVWTKDYFDRMVRDAEHFWRCARYIRRNPMKAKLSADEFTLLESDHVRDVLDGKANG
jgi:putative transposase